MDAEQEFIPATVKLEETLHAQAAPSANKYPIGYRFKPTDEELITHYLMEKIKNNPIPVEEINDVDIRTYDPKTLSERFPSFENKEWYFFTPRDRKYPKGTRPDRAAGVGHWKATGSDKAIKVDGKTVGFRTTLVHDITPTAEYPNGKTGWVMNEFRVNQPPRTKTNEQDMRLDDCVLCRIHYKQPRNTTIREVINPVVPSQPATEENTINAANDDFALTFPQTNDGSVNEDFASQYYQNFPVDHRFHDYDESGPILMSQPNYPIPIQSGYIMHEAGPSFANDNTGQSNVDQFQNWFDQYDYGSIMQILMSQPNGSMSMLQNDFNNHQNGLMPMQNEFNQELNSLGFDITFDDCGLLQQQNDTPIIGDGSIATHTHDDAQTNYPDNNQIAPKRRRSM